MNRIGERIQSLASSFAVLLVLIGLGITVLMVFGALYLVGLFFERVVFSGR